MIFITLVSNASPEEHHITKIQHVARGLANRHLECASPQLCLARDMVGRAEFRGPQTEAQRLRVSFSHTRRASACAVSRTSWALGLDLEERPDSPQDRHRLRSWVRSEAALKALGIGLTRGLTPLHAENEVLNFQSEIAESHPKRLETLGLWLVDLPFFPGFSAALAYRNSAVLPVVCVHSELPV